MAGEMITVSVELRGTLRRLAPAEACPRFGHGLPAGATVGELLAALELPAGRVGLVAVNGRKAPREQVLADGDRVERLVPVPSGG
ncbi:MAG TPA: MoaD/ThiS family protein [Anaerolineae bacterium]|nr:MoaD/ThiS family protein [Anaerolineae bacterium]HOQ99834.1 MoaD/ThiS family protein [Anaerolineae bacterium]HPL30578.1 MoaD/ThiS family protein [Anaerolineae bacterium]